MKNIALSNSALLEKIKNLALEEKKLQAEFLIHLKEMEKRKLFLSLGFPSLFAYLVTELGYSESASYRRISAMRVLKETPDEVIQTKIQTGALNLSNLSKAYSFIKKTKELEKKQVLSPSLETKNLFEPQNKIEKIIKSIENKSTRDVEKHFIKLNPEAMLKKEQLRTVAENKTELKIILDQEQMEKLDELRFLLSHINPNMGYKELIDYLADFGLKTIKSKLTPKVSASSAVSKTSDFKYDEMKFTPKNKDVNRNIDKNLTANSETNKSLTASSEMINNTILKEQTQNQKDTEVVSKCTSGAKVRSRYIPSVTKKRVYERDQGCCSYVDVKTGRKCGSKYQVQIDHLQPFAFGGSHELSNLRLLCAQHNRFRNFKSLQQEKRAGNSDLPLLNRSI